MDQVAPAPKTGSAKENAPTAAEKSQPAPTDKVNYSASNGLISWLAKENISIGVTSYQSGQFYLLGRNPRGGLMINQQGFKKAMGLFVENGGITLATLHQILRFENALRPNERAEELFDACFVPRVAYTTGVLDAHDVAVTKSGEIVFVNTRFNCIASVSPRHSFKPVWVPPFISSIVDEDRCHLNGLALEDGELAYVTAASRSDTVDGWRDRRSGGGIVMDVRTGEVICDGLSMPHSPRVHNGQLWVLDSGTGRLGIVNRETRSLEEVAFCPGFARGLSFHGNYAIVGLSKPRYQRFEGLALDDRLRETDSEPWCGVQVIDLQKRSVAAWFRIDGAVAELYDVCAVPGVACGMSLAVDSPQLRSLVTIADP